MRPWDLLFDEQAQEPKKRPEVRQTPGGLAERPCYVGNQAKHSAQAPVAPGNRARKLKQCPK